MRLLVLALVFMCTLVAAGCGQAPAQRALAKGDLPSLVSKAPATPAGVAYKVDDARFVSFEHPDVVQTEASLQRLGLRTGYVTSFSAETGSLTAYAGVLLFTTERGAREALGVLESEAEDAEAEELAADELGPGAEGYAYRDVGESRAIAFAWTSGKAVAFSAMSGSRLAEADARAFAQHLDRRVAAQLGLERRNGRLR